MDPSAPRHPAGPAVALKVCAAHLAQQPQLLRLTYARANETHKNDTIKTFSIAANIIR